jgi:hypothetical protein
MEKAYLAFLFSPCLTNNTVSDINYAVRFCTTLDMGITISFLANLGIFWFVLENFFLFSFSGTD